MMRTPASRQAPLSQHQAFVPLVTLWLAALFGGCLAASGLSPSLWSGGSWAFAGVATCIGGAIGWAAARLFARSQRRKRPAASVVPSAYVDNLLGGISNTPRPWLNPEPEQPDPRHGKAVHLLRTRNPNELAMPLLIERFAVALEEHQSPKGTLPVELGFELYALRNHFSKAVRTGADSLSGEAFALSAPSDLPHE
ncbi:MAG: hypothetical protein ACO25F_07200 [Erythrobacter sp.]